MATVSNSTSRIMNVKLLSLIIIQVESSAAIDVFIGPRLLLVQGRCNAQSRQDQEVSPFQTTKDNCHQT